MSESASQAILRQLGMEQRRVFAGWRALVLLRRATDQLPPMKRRWTRFPGHPADIATVIRQMTRNEQIRLIMDRPKVYEVLVPYANLLQVLEPEVLLEANPYAVLSHMTALVLHRLSDDLPQDMMVTASREMTGDLLPLGTTSEDWTDLPFPPAPQLPRIFRSDLKWTTVAPNRFFGFATYQPNGVPIRVTTPEDIVAEKLRALLQQPIRNRQRRQDLLDSAVIVTNQPALDRAKIARFLLLKAAARDVPVSRAAFQAPAVAELARRDYAPWR